MQKFKKYWQERGGVSAIVFALVLPVLIASAGLAVDLANAYNVRNRLANALDKAALATGNSSGTEDELRAIAENFFHANFRDDGLGTAYSINVVFGAQTVTVSASASVDMQFMQIFGMGDLLVSAATEVTRIYEKDVEIAVVLDVSGSMAGSRIEELKEAATSLVNIVVPDTPLGDTYSKVALVPYSMGVNVGSYASQVRGSTSDGTCLSPGCQYYKFQNPYGNWRTFPNTTCVSERVGTYAYTDDPPSTALVGRNYQSQYNPCIYNRIMPLTSNKADLFGEIDDLQTGGSTGAHIGLAWGWYLVSPNFGYLFPEESRPAAYGTENLFKIVILMTDGEFNSPYCNGVISRDATNGSGSLSEHINCYSPNGSSYSQAEQLCTAMKAAGIIVYTIGFEISNFQSAVDVMANCATSEDHAYLASEGGELQAAFIDIANKISTLFVSQ